MRRMTDTTEPEIRGGAAPPSRLRGQLIAAAIIVAGTLQGCAAVPSDEEELLAVEAAPQPGATNAVIDWHVHTDTAFHVTARQPPYLTSFGVAMTHGAVYDAVNAIARTHQPLVASPRAKRWYSKDAAAATAAYRVLVSLLPEQRSTLKQRYDESLAAISDGAAKSGGIGVGEQAAAAMLAARENDGRDRTLTWAADTDLGQWRPTPPDFGDVAARNGFVKPFAIPSAEAFRSEGPLALTSEAYAREFKEVKEIGSRSSATRTRDQTEAALYWHAAPWGSVVRSIAVSQGLGIAEMARLFGMLAIASADSTSACFNDKYHWNFWRPVTAIREAAGDGNPATDLDPSWTPLIDTPPFPEHPSGHSCASGALTSVLRDFFGTDKIAFSAFSALSGTTRTFTSFSQALDEIVDARIWAGVHLRTADVQGVTLGQEVAKHIQRHSFQPLW